MIKILVVFTTNNYIMHFTFMNKTNILQVSVIKYFVVAVELKYDYKALIFCFFT